MRKADRLFQLVNLIRTHQPITAAALAERLGVSVRTVYRYVDDLSLSGIPIYGEAGVGYAMQNNFELPPLTLTADELDALLLSLEMLSQSVGYDLQAAAGTLLSKMEAALPGRNLAPAAAHLRMLSALYSDSQRRAWDQLRRLIRDQKPCAIDYLSLGDTLTQRTVYPLGLFYWGGKWTLATWCLLRQDYREFRVDRIHRVRSAPAETVLPTGVNLTAYMQYQTESWAKKTDMSAND